MSTTSLSVNIANSVRRTYQIYEKAFIGTDAATAVEIYLEISYPSRDDLDTLRNSLIAYKNTLTPNQISIHGKLVSFLEPIESELLFEHQGFTSLNANNNKEHTNGLTFENIRDALILNIAGQTTVDSYSKAIANTIHGPRSTEFTTTAETLNAAMIAGTANNNVVTAITTLTTALNGLTLTSAKTIAAAVYDGTLIVDSSETTDQDAFAAKLTEYSNSDLFITTSSVIGEADISNIVTLSAAEVGSTLTDAVIAIDNKVGITQIAPHTPVTVRSCTYSSSTYSIDSDIYTTSNDATQTIYNMIRCGHFVSQSGQKHLTPTGLVEDCTSMSNNGDAISQCLKFLLE